MPTKPDRESLIAENQQLALECADLRAENDRLRQLLQSKGIDDTPDTSEVKGLTVSAPLDENEQQLTKHSPNQDKVTLFQSLFCGRPDVYARQWKGKGNKPGYSPACKNEWVRGVCGKPKSKCSNCKSAACLPYDAIAIEQHLRGQCVVGIYPLLTDDTCSFLAIDFRFQTPLRQVTDRLHSLFFFFCLCSHLYLPVYRLVQQTLFGFSVELKALPILIYTLHFLN